MTDPVIHFAVHDESDRGPITFDRPYTVVYDGHCKICGRFVKVLRSWDTEGLLTIVPSQTPGVRAWFPWIPPRAFDEAIQLIGPGDKTWQAAEAIEMLLDILPRGRWLSWAFDVPGFHNVANCFYHWFARNRYRLGCGEHCQYRPPPQEC